MKKIRIILFICAFALSISGRTASAQPLWLVSGMTSELWLTSVPIQMHYSVGFMYSPWFLLMQWELEKERDLFDKDSTDIILPSIYQPPAVKRSPIGKESFGKKPSHPDGYYLYQNIDSTGENIYSQESVDRFEISYPYSVPLDNYLKQRKKQIQSRVWDSLLTRYDLKQALSGGDLARLIGQATGLTIPIPPNPLMGIFGKPEIAINVNGEVNIRIGWRWDSQNLGTVSAFGQTQSSPIFSQDIRVNVSARIGDKLKIGTNWNTRRTFDYENEFKIGYDGEDDDIIKKVEIGNVTLPLPSTLIGGGQALFGVRADFQFGPLFLKTLFSQRRGQRKWVDVVGGSNKQYFSIRAYDYAKNHFFLDTAYKAVYREYFKYSTPIFPAQYGHLRIKEIEVWEATNDVRDAHFANSIAIADLPPVRYGEFYGSDVKSRPIEPGAVERGRFLRLDSSRYSIDRNLGTLSIHNLRQDRYYAVAYVIEGPTEAPGDDIYYGTLTAEAAQADSLVLKLIYRPNIQPGFKTLWSRQMKNVYSMNATNINLQETRIGVWYNRQSNDSVDVLDGAPDKLVTILGVDRVNNGTGAAPPDGMFDMRPPFFNSYTGDITFPSVEPFRQGLRDYFSQPSINNPELAEQYVFNEVYDTTYDVARRNTARDRFVISGEVSGRASNRISLGAFNIAPGSVRVFLDGVPLREFEDYIVDAYAGTLTMRNPRAMLPNANLKIEYEQHDIFNISTKTLAGIRADYNLFKSRTAQSDIGMTLMHYNQSAVVDRVRLGEEPVSNTMLGFDIKFNWNTLWLTELLDLLPFYDTKAQSSINLRGEWAMIMPEPNKRRSQIAEDNNEPVVYIDDFEGAQRYITLGLTAAQWSHSSQPIDSSIAPTEKESALFRGKQFWYQYFIPYLDYQEVYPNYESVHLGRSKLSPLHIDFNPYRRGIYNMNPEFVDTLNPQFDPVQAQNFFNDNNSKLWGGMMRLFSSFNTNFDTENIEYIEIMMRIDAWEPGKTKMYIDLGQISEDVIPNGSLDTEDGSTAANPYPNGIIDAGEDTGLDIWDNPKEREMYPYPLNLEDDPARDDYIFDFNKPDIDRRERDFEKYNNFEGNALVSELGQFPDTEILNKANGQEISLHNSYFSYEVDLLPDENRNPMIVGGANNWYLYRIPIRKPSRRVGDPLFSNIQYIRVWFKGGLFKGRIVDWKLVGSQWQRISNFQSNVPPNDSTMQIAFVNLWENSGPPEYYTMPPGVDAPRQLNNPDPTQDIKMNEQSLAISVKNLRYGDERMAVRIFHQMDLFYYKKMKFFVHGNGTMPDAIVPGSAPKGYMFIRFGIDSSNYYEYRRPILRGWQSVNIDLEALTAIKQVRDTSSIYDRQGPFPVPGDQYGFFSIRGNPILTRVQFFGLGISNPAEQFPNELTTTMWVNELRLISPESRNDWAAVASMDVKLADLGSINANISTTQPNFHRLEERFGNRNSSTNWTVSMVGNLEKFAPKEFSQLKIPITYTHSEFMDNPEFVANSDINLEEAAMAAGRGLEPDKAKVAESVVRTRSQTLRVQDSWALTGVRLGLPVKHWLVDDTFNKLNIGYSYSQEFERSPIYEQRFMWMWRLSLQYAVTVSNILQFQPLTWMGEETPVLGTYSGLKINPLPVNISAGMDMTRRRTTEQSRFLSFPSPVVRDFMAMRSMQASWKLAEGGFFNPSIDYNFNTLSTLVPLELDETGKQRTGSQIAKEMFFNDGALINLGLDNQHSQTVVINLKPKVPNIAGINRYIDLTGVYNVAYQWSDPLQPDPDIRDIAKSASWNRNLRFNMAITLKAAADGWFGIQPTRKTPQRVPAPKDTTPKDFDFWTSFGLVMKTIFLDYERIDFNFTQTGNSVNPGVFGGNGMTNFWARGMTFRSSENLYGPTFPYQLGLISNPHGGYNMRSSDKFPYFGFDTYPGLRPPNAILQDNFTEKTTFDIRTSRPLWEGATLELNWKTDMAFNKSQTVLTNEDGVPKFTNVIAMESFNRTYLTMPSFFGLNIFNNTLENVIDLYTIEKERIRNSDLDTVQKNRAMQTALSESFYKGLEAFSFFGGAAGKFLPGINWGIRWEGLEKFALWNDLIKVMTVEHVYTSQYTESVQITDKGRAIQSQQVQYGFNPLVRVTANFDEKKVNGTLTASLQWGATTNYQLTSAGRSTIYSQTTHDLTGQASYTMKGFEFPFLGINLKNDLELSFLGTLKSNGRVTYNIDDEEAIKSGKGRTLDGNTQIIIEPRARYSIDNRLTASFFVRYEGTFTEGAAQPGFHTTQLGLDIRLSISGGR